MNKLWVSAATAILLLILSVFFVSAQYTFTGPQQITVQSCHYGIYTLQLTNTGVDAIKPILSLAESSPIRDWVVFDPQSPLVVPGQTQNITVFIRVPCKQQGTFPIGFEISNVDTPMILEQTLRVERINNIAAQGQQTIVSSCPCQPQTFTFTVQNNAQFPDVYRFSLQGNADYITVVPGREILFPGEQMQGTVFINTPCEFSGPLDFNVIVESENAGFAAQIPYTYTVDACYDYTVQTPQPIAACIDGNTAFNVTVQNQMYFSNDYTFSVSPSWATLEQGNQLSLAPNQTGVLPIILAPRSGIFGQAPGTYTFTIEGTSSKGNAQVLQRVPVQVLSCFDFSLDAPQDVVVCPGQSVIPITLTNAGMFDEEFIFAIDGPAFLQLSPAQLNVSAGQTATLNLSTNYSAFDSQTYPTTIYAQIANNALQVKALNVNIRAVDDNACYAVTFQPLTFNLGEQNQSHIINITNVGYRQANYTLALFGQEWIALQDTSVRLDPQQSQIITVITSAPQNISGNYFATLQATAHNQTYASVLRFSTPQNLRLIILIIAAVVILVIIGYLLWLAYKRSTRSQTKQETLREIVEEAKVGATKEHVHEETQKTTIVEEHKTIEHEEPYDTYYQPSKFSGGWWLIPLAVLLIIVLLLFAPRDDGIVGQNQTNATNDTVVPEQIFNQTIPGGVSSALTQRQVDILLLADAINNIPEELRDSFVYQIIEENSSTTVNLSERFQDPDQEELFYTAFAVPNVTISVQQGIATITPEPDFIGVRYTVFFARDPQGEIAQSPVISIIVVPQNVTQQAAQIREQYGDLESLEDLFIESNPILGAERQRVKLIISSLVFIIAVVLIAILSRRFSR